MRIRPRLIVATLFCVLASVSVALADPIRIVDTLGAVTTDATFDLDGSSGVSIIGLTPTASFQFVGPQITLVRPTLITSVGAFVNACGAGAVNGSGTCTAGSPVSAEIRPAGLNSASPDPHRVIASFALSTDADPRTISFESASVRLTLQPGTYFALFTLPPGEGGFVLASAQQPFAYTALRTTIGVVDSNRSFLENAVAAVQITAAPTPEPSTLVSLLSGIVGAVGSWRRRRRG